MKGAEAVEEEEGEEGRPGSGEEEDDGRLKEGGAGALMVGACWVCPSCQSGHVWAQRSHGGWHVNGYEQLGSVRVTGSEVCS